MNRGRNMEFNYVYINSNLFHNLLKEWKERNKEVLLPMTEFCESIGLVYNRIYKDEYRFVLYDQQKYFLAKIQYGL